MREVSALMDPQNPSWTKKHKKTNHFTLDNPYLDPEELSQLGTWTERYRVSNLFIISGFQMVIPFSFSHGHFMGDLGILNFRASCCGAGVANAARVRFTWRSTGSSGAAWAWEARARSHQTGSRMSLSATLEELPGYG